MGARSGARSCSLTDYGAFVELESGVEGLIHVSEMSWSKHVKHPVEDPERRRSSGCDGSRRRFHGASHLARLEAGRGQPLARSGREVPVGSKITGKVRNLTEFGAFVEVEEDIDGLVHISDMSWSKRVKHPSEC